MLSYGLKLAAVGIAFLVAGLLGMWLFSALWVRVSLGAAVVIVIGGLVLLVWRMDRKDRASRAGLERI